MTANRIREVATTYFANHGYEGASLADIAVEVGIKTPSIYAHYKGKDELFLSVMEKIAASELQFVHDFFVNRADEPLQARLYDFLIMYKKHYEQDLQTKLWLRMAFFPPAHLYEQINHYTYDYLDQIEGLLIPLFEQALSSKNIRQVGAQRAAVAYVAILDGLAVELLYGGPERAMKRLEASWYMYWLGLTNE